MKRNRRIEPGEQFPVAFTARERALVIDHTFAGPELTVPLEAARLTRGKCSVRYSLDDLDELVGHVAAEANHAKSKSVRQELDALFARLQDEMESHNDGLWQEPVKSPKGVGPTQLAPLSVVKGGKGP